MKENLNSSDDRPSVASGRLSNQRDRILVALLTACALGSVAAIWWYYIQQRDAMENAAIGELAAIAEMKTKQIANWRQERIGDGRVLASSPLMPLARQALAGRTLREPDRAVILRFLSALSGAFSYSSASLVDLDGKVLVELNRNHGDAAQLAAFAREAAQSGNVQLSDLYRDRQSKRILLAVTIPVSGAGAFILDIDASRFLYPYLDSWPTARRTGETFLLLLRPLPDGMVYISQPRQARKSPLVFERALAAAELPDEDTLSVGWFREELDYRGIPALMILRRVPDSSWFLNVQIDGKEADAPLRRLRLELISILALMGLASGGGVGLVWRNQRMKERIRTGAEIQALNARLITAQEEERAHLARELHDDVSQQVAAASIAVSHLKRQISADQTSAREQSDRVQQRLAHLAEGIRRLSHELHPAVLEHAGLASALRAYCEEFSELTGVKVAVNIDGSFEDLPSTTALCVYRIAQETLQNVAKHAKVADASLHLKCARGMVDLTIADRGIGMTQVKGVTSPGLGLLSIKERTRLANGTVKILSRPNRGTTVVISVPVEIRTSN